MNCKSWQSSVKNQYIISEVLRIVSEPHVFSDCREEKITDEKIELNMGPASREWRSGATPTND